MEPAVTPITLTDAISAYIRDCRTLKGLAESTVRRYEISLRQFARALVAVEPYILMEFVPKSAYLDWVMLANANANKTFNARRSHMSAFLTWCYERDYLRMQDRHLAYVKERPNTTSRAKSFVKAQDMPKVAQAARQWHERDAAFCEALWASWRRSGELAALRVRDVDTRAYPDSPHGRLTWTNAKAHRPNQVLDMSPDLQDCLSRWMAAYTEMLGRELRPSDYLFPALRPEGMTVKGKRRRLALAPEHPIGQPDSIARGAFQRAGVYVEGMACHAFRRGAADALYDLAAEKGHRNPLRLAMTALDHRSEAQTEGYLNKDRDRRDLAMFLAEVAAPEPVIEARDVVSLAQWRRSRLG
jgi:integrase